MVTVATKLDVPIKLQFAAASRRSILGLGDIVLPGIVMAFALRLDLWFHYQRKVKYESTELQLVQKDATSGEVSTTSHTKFKEVKAPYVNVKNGWGDRAWSSHCALFSAARQLPHAIAATHFSKTYFHATVVGYSLGMAITLAMLLVFKRGQPALLYLVPGVLISLYLTAIARGELKQIWGYTEDGSIDTIDTVVDLDGNGRVIKSIGKLKNGIVDTTIKDEDSEDQKEAGKTSEKDGKVTTQASQGSSSDTPSKSSHHVFLLSLEAPPESSLDAGVENKS